VVEQRRSKRFNVKLPVKLVRNGLRSITGAGETMNLSSGGVLFASDTRIEIGEPIEYVITLAPSGEVDLHCLGKVMRLDSAVRNGGEPDKPFEVAATVERYEFIRQRS
jgi:hypothetical protein